MKLLVDMNLSPDWIPALSEKGWEAVHWPEVGTASAPDHELMQWAREHGHAILTQDLDFTQLLFTSGDAGPSVVLLRLKDEFDAGSRNTVFNALSAARADLKAGALLTISPDRARLRKLPINPSNH